MVTNPVLPGFHPDPCAVRVGGDYYLATSTFEWFPGVEIHHSTDLAHWTLVARPLNTPELLNLRNVPNSGGVWAPCLSYANGQFYLLYSITRTVEETTQDTENYLTSAPDVKGPWSPPVRLHSGGFDASLFHDPDGTHWVVGMRWDSRVEQNHFAGIFLQEYSVPQQWLLGQPRLIFQGSSLGLTEGPHLYAHEGTYLLMVAEGGTRDDHAVLVSKASTRFGPYTPDPDGFMLTARHQPNWPIQYAGHGSLVDDGADHWFLFHLGSRKNRFGGFSVLGRETFAQNVAFNKLGYPRLTAGGSLPQEALMLPGPQPEPVDWAFACDFSVPVLPLRFAWLRTPPRHSLTERPGALRLYGAQSMLSHHEQSMLGIPLYQAPLTVRVRLAYQPSHFQQAAGLALFYHTANFYALLVTWDDALGRCLRLTKRDSKHTSLLAAMQPLPPQGDVRLRVDMDCDSVRFFWDDGQGWREIGNVEQQPVRILSDEYANRCGEQGYTGAFAALCCQDQTGGEHPADFTAFTLCPPNHAMLGRDTI